MIKKIEKRIYKYFLNDYSRIELSGGYFRDKYRPIKKIGPYSLLTKPRIKSRGNIFPAIDQRNGKTVILKACIPAPVINSKSEPQFKNKDNSEAVFASYLHEFNMLKKLNHKNFVKPIEQGDHVVRFYYGYSIKKFLIRYFVYELVKGITLSKYIESQNFSFSEKLEVCIQLCECIRDLHSQNIKFLDLQPNNIMVQSEKKNSYPNQKLKMTLIDFESSLHENEISPILKFNQIRYTPAFASPEQICHFTKIDRRSDIYSLCSVIFFIFVKEPYRRYVAENNSYNLDLNKFNDTLPTRLLPFLSDGLQFDRDQRILDIEALICELKNLYHEVQANSSTCDASKQMATG